MAADLEVFTDYICPWCYLSTARTHRLQQAHGVKLSYTFYPLHPDTPPGGIPLAEYFRGRGFDIEAAHRQMKVRMAAEGLPYSPNDRILDSRLAQELGKWADAQGKPEIHDRLYRAYHAEGVDISDVEALVSIAVQVGLPEAEARAVLQERRMKGAIDADWERARGIGVTGVPTFLNGRRAVVGAQPYDVLERLISPS